MKNTPMPASKRSSVMDRIFAWMRWCFFHRVSLRISPILIAVILIMPILLASVLVQTYAQNPEKTVPEGFDPSRSKSLAEFLAALCAQSYKSIFPAEAAFLGGNALAMSKMMTGMAITPTGNADSDFVHMMVPHHQGAIDMAILELRYGHNPILKRLAQEIVVDQQQEITAMYLAINEPLPPSAPAPTWTDSYPSSAGQ